MPHETAIAMGSLIFGGVFVRYPNLRICFAHGGGCFPGLIGRLRHGFHARPDLCQLSCKIDPINFIRNCYVDSLCHDPDMLQCIVKKFGSDRVILGTDYPFPLGEIDYPGRLIDETYTPASLPLPTPPSYQATTPRAILPPPAAGTTCSSSAGATDDAETQMLQDRENMLWRNAASFLKLSIPELEQLEKVTPKL